MPIPFLLLFQGVPTVATIQSLPIPPAQPPAPPGAACATGTLSLLPLLRATRSAGAALHYRGGGARGRHRLVEGIVARRDRLHLACDAITGGGAACAVRGTHLALRGLVTDPFGVAVFRAGRWRGHDTGVAPLDPPGGRGLPGKPRREDGGAQPGGPAGAGPPGHSARGCGTDGDAEAPVTISAGRLPHGLPLLPEARQGPHG